MKTFKNENEDVKGNFETSSCRFKFTSGLCQKYVKIMH